MSPDLFDMHCHLGFCADSAQAARELAAQYGIKAYLEAYKPPLIDLGGAGGYRTELEFDDGTVLTADTAGTWEEPLEHFFKELELRCAGETEK